MSDHDNDFSTEMPEFASHEDHEHEAGYPVSEDAQDEAPVRKSRKTKKASSQSGLMKTLLPIIAVAVVAGGGYAGYEYYQSTSLTPSVAGHHTRVARGSSTTGHGDFPVRGANFTPPTPDASAPSPASPLSQPLPPAPTPAPTPAVVAPPSALSLPPSAPTQAPSQTPEPPLQSTDPMSPSASVQAPPLLNNGFTSKPKSITPAPDAVATPAAASGSSSESMMDVLNHLDDAEKQTRDVVTKGNETIKSEIDDKTSMLADKIDNLTAKADQLSKQIDGLNSQALQPKKEDSLHLPVQHPGVKHRSALHRPVAKSVKSPKVEADTTQQTITSWRLRGTSKDFVVLQDQGGKYRVVKIGGEAPGTGTIQGLKKADNGHWIVQTSTGTIQE